MAVLLVVQHCFLHTSPRYYASIPSVSGVADDDGQRMQFALTLGVEARGLVWGWGCLPRRTAVEVAYRGVPLADGASSKDVCVGPGLWDLYKVQKTTVVARRSGFMDALPESVLEGLVADMRRGVQVFDVTVRIPSTTEDGDRVVKLASCMARLVGDDEDKPCDVHYSY
jgi:hypothetical protein